jgi:hypothetical protein
MLGLGAGTLSEKPGAHWFNIAAKWNTPQALISWCDSQDLLSYYLGRWRHIKGPTIREWLRQFRIRAKKFRITRKRPVMIIILVLGLGLSWKKLNEN